MHKGHELRIASICVMILKMLISDLLQLEVRVIWQIWFLPLKYLHKWGADGGIDQLLGLLGDYSYIR